MNLSTEQLRDAAGNLEVTAKQEGAVFEVKKEAVQSPTYEELALLYGKSANSDSFVIAPEYNEHKQRVGSLALEKLRLKPNARVMAALRTTKGTNFFAPAIVLEDSEKFNRLRLGALYAKEDLRPANNPGASLTPFQQALLLKIAEQHKNNSGAHTQNGNVNAGENTHGVAIAAINNPSLIHEITHEYVYNGQFSKNIANNGHTDFETSKGVRENREQIIESASLIGALVFKSHQVPFKTTNSFEATAGFTYAAGLSRGQTPDLSRNLSGMAA